MFDSENQTGVVCEVEDGRWKKEDHHHVTFYQASEDALILILHYTFHSMVLVAHRWEAYASSLMVPPAGQRLGPR